MSNGSSVIVTGAAGFVGARTVEALTARGFSVVSVDHLDKFDTRPEHASINFGTRVGLESIDEWLGTHGKSISAIVHMGACTDTREKNRA